MKTPYLSKSEPATPEPAAVDESKLKFWQFDLLQLAILLGITYVSVYHTSLATNKIIFLLFLPIVYKTKKDYLWLIWFFILLDAPGRLFSAKGLYDMRLPIYSLGGGVSFEFQEAFLAVYLVKMYFQNRSERLQYLFKKEFRYFYIIMFFCIGYSFLLGMSVRSIIQTAKFLLPWAWIVIIPYFINDSEKVMKASKLIFPLVFLGLVTQIHTFITGNFLDNELRGVKPEFDFTVSKGGDASRALSAPFVCMFGFVQALFYLASDNKHFSKNYLGIVVFVSAVQMFLSATRGWTLAFGFVIALSVFQLAQGGKIRGLFNLTIASIFVLYILQWVFPPIQYQIQAAGDRISTLLLLVEGDINAGGTLQRIDVRGARVMEVFYKSPVIGWGFSNTYHESADGHVGLQNILLNVGVFGFVYLTVFYLYLCAKIWLLGQNREIRQKWGKSPRIYVFGLLGIFIIHGSSTQFWGYVMHFDQTEKILTISLILAAVNVLFLPFYKEKTAPSPSGKRPQTHYTSGLEVS